MNYARKMSEKEMTKGCVQGFIGGATFWNIILDSLLNELCDKQVHYQMIVEMWLGLSLTDRSDLCRKKPTVCCGPSCYLESETSSKIRSKKKVKLSCLRGSCSTTSLSYKRPASRSSL
ncbi:hypothetical protein EVAR_67017_1 [Eumeta japonica]|uniref:Uncharacterized protein n=1 Tax=Eumeta variegata TaxID=151549 RepID=A0A4C1ZSR0_EUMVA|nr:hypothetical protein EVAR_67017_1 [Eumeta japonica]